MKVLLASGILALGLCCAFAGGVKSLVGQEFSGQAPKGATCGAGSALSIGTSVSNLGVCLGTYKGKRIMWADQVVARDLKGAPSQRKITDVQQVPASGGDEHISQDCFIAHSRTDLVRLTGTIALVAKGTERSKVLRSPWKVLFGRI